MPNYKIILSCCFLSLLCLIVPAYHDFYTPWNKPEFFAFLAILYLGFNGLFYCLYKNFLANFPLRKYGMTSILTLAIIILTSAGFYHTADIPTLGAMLLYFVIFLPVMGILTVVCNFFEHKYLKNSHNI